MSETFYRITFVVLWIAYIAIRAPYQSRYKTLEKATSQAASREKLLLLLLTVGLIVVPILWVFGLLDRFVTDLPDWVRLTGIAVALLSLVYFRRIHKALASNWSPTLEIFKDHELITNGPYKHIRHPMYTQIWIWALAQALITSNAVASLSGLLTWAVVYFVRVPEEERMMNARFGTEYSEYAGRSGRILPKIWKR